MAGIRHLTEGDLPRLRKFWLDYWGGDVMIVHGETIRYDQVEGLIHGAWTGALTYIIRGDECEIVSLNSVQEGIGIGTALIGEVVKEAKARRCRRIVLTTTNDNLHALGFYQRHGFALKAIRPGAINETRKIKPSIPLIGENNIPLRDEIELEMMI
ncbi:MAG: GNAT family N-acetyltransferase [Chloroflexota bacterium]